MTDAQQQVDLKEARKQMSGATAQYNRLRYMCDEAYRERVKATMRGRYTRKTRNCEICKYRMKLEETVCRRCVETEKKAMRKAHKHQIAYIVNNLPDA
jgi:hypothetical protein